MPYLRVPQPQVLAEELHLAACSPGLQAHGLATTTQASPSLQAWSLDCLGPRQRKAKVSCVRTLEDQVHRQRAHLDPSKEELDKTLVKHVKVVEASRPSGAAAPSPEEQVSKPETDLLQLLPSKGCRVAHIHGNKHTGDVGINPLLGPSARTLDDLHKEVNHGGAKWQGHPLACRNC